MGAGSIKRMYITYTLAGIPATRLSWNPSQHLIYMSLILFALYTKYHVAKKMQNFEHKQNGTISRYYNKEGTLGITVEPLYKDTPEMRTSPLIRTPCTVPATYTHREVYKTYR